MSEQEEVPKPVVHLNGSGYKNLEEQYHKAADVLEAAYHLLPVPHPRDYYPLGDDAYAKARSKFKEQIESLGKLRDEVLETYRHIYNSKNR